MKQENVIRHLRHSFTPEEQRTMSSQLAQVTQTLEGLEEQKKQVASQLNASIDEATATQRNLARKLNNGYEYRDTDCYVQFDCPEPGQKSVFRKDTDDHVETLAMSAEERQQCLKFEGEEQA